MIQVILADSQNLTRKALAALLATQPDFRIVGEAEDGLTAIQLSERTKSAVLLLELALPRLHGLEVIRSVSGTPVKPIVVSAADDCGLVSEALRFGAFGFVLKTDSPNDLFTAIRTAIAGDRFISPALRKAVYQLAMGSFNGQPADPYHTLTDRERVVLALAAEGLSNAQIAKKLFISARTVESHRANLMKKLNLDCQTSLVRFAVRRNLINP